MAYSLYNGNKYATRDGVVSSGSMVSPDVDGGALKMMGTANAAGLRASAINQGDADGPFIQPRTDVGPAQWTSSITNGSATSGNGVQGLLRINFTTGNPHSLSVGQVVVITDSITGIKGAARVYSIPNTTGVILNRAYQASTGNITLSTAVGTMAGQTVGNYIMKRVAGTVHGQSTNTMLIAGAVRNDSRDKVHKVNAVRTSKVATAIRAGYWNVFTGSWTTAPSVSNDYTLFDLDGSDAPDDTTKDSTSSYGLRGEFTYQQQRTPVTGDYEAKTG